MTAKLTRLHDRALISVSGPDWRSFLQGLITQDVETLAVGELRYGALLTPQGRLLFDMFLKGETEGALLDVHAARRHELAQRLAMYRLRAKVTVETPDGGVFALWGGEAVSEGWTPDPRLPGLGFRGYGLASPPAAGAELVEPEAYEEHRLALGVTDPARDCADEGAYPIEVNFDLLNGIDFKKGCFVGQETTSRMKRRAQIRSRLVPLTFDGAPPAAGAEVLAGASLRAGEVRSGRDGRALALLRLDRAQGAELTVDGRPVQIDLPAWIAQGLI